MAGEEGREGGGTPHGRPKSKLSWGVRCEQRLAGTWAGVALAGGRSGCVSSATIWSAGAAGWAGEEEGSVALSMTLSF